MNSYEISLDLDNKLILWTHTGTTIYRAETGSAWRTIISIEEFGKGWNILTDFRKSKFNFGIEDTKPIWEFFEIIRDDIDGKKQAVLSNDPNTIQTILCFQQNIYRFFNFEVMFFQNKDKAIIWLKNGF